MDIITENLKFLGMQLPAASRFTYSFVCLQNTLSLIALISFINILMFFSAIFILDQKNIAEKIAKIK